REPGVVPDAVGRRPRSVARLDRAHARRRPARPGQRRRGRGVTGEGAVVWITGLPASGKSTLATAIAAQLRAAGTPPIVLDGDEVRAAIVPRHGYDPDGRDAFYRTLGKLAALIARQGAIVLVPATA